VAPVGTTTSYILRTLALQIQEIRNEYNLTVQHIKADKLSRREILLHEWKLPRKMVQDNRKILGETDDQCFCYPPELQGKNLLGFFMGSEAAATYTFTQAWVKKNCTSSRPGSRFHKIQEAVTT
jgi:RecA-family ATPase